MVTKGQVAKAGAAVGGGVGLAFLLSKTVAAKTPTNMVTTTEPPGSIDVGTSFPFEGYLQDEDGNRLAGKEIQLIVDGSRVKSATTDSGGRWAFSITLEEEGPHEILAEFPGDAEFKGSSGWL